jgi:hypothetical protein
MNDYSSVFIQLKKQTDQFWDLALHGNWPAAQAVSLQIMATALALGKSVQEK